MYNYIAGGVDPLFLLELAEIYRAHGMVNYATTTYQQITKAFSGDERLVALLQLTHLFISVDKWEEAQETIVQLNKLQAVSIFFRQNNYDEAGLTIPFYRTTRWGCICRA